MPYYSEHYENSEQEWEPVQWTKTHSKDNTKKVENDEPRPFYRQLVNARQKSLMTKHKLAQAFGMKVKILTSYENGKEIPEKKILARINKILGSKLQLPK